ncbi:MAG: TetR/AcrR family transcriptional regulator C-terminal domain-containing protein [Clostridia bacterium]|nr:TetR/AcrR family transcriptional regulator C-terminal domain-containing protein [Clostridia bacterium]MBQ6373547.1 TetR/AcrR family transcriptional regulator C-terminal domain-containing protein [Clostridia bacterium]
MKDALMELMENRPLASVSITELCSRADVNRSTFYSYYSDLPQLLKEVEDDIIGHLPEAKPIDDCADLDKQLIEDFTLFFGYVRKHARSFSILLQSGDIHFREHLIDTIMSRFRRKPTKAVDPLMSRWSYLYCLNGTFGMMQDWISRDFPMSDREFAELVLLMGFRASGFPKCIDHR